MKGYWAILVITLGIILFSITAYAQSSAIPDWVKNNAKWWSEGQIGESDYIQSLQYLISQGIIEIPITKVMAVEVSLTDDNTAQSFVVHFSKGSYFTETVTIYTYSEFFHFSTAVFTGQIPKSPTIGVTPVFLLRGLPSTDKQVIYGLVDRYTGGSGAYPTKFDVAVDIISGDGTTLQSWEYGRCDVYDYSTYSDFNKDQYRYGKSDKPEIREVLIIGCAGFHLKT